VSAGTCVRGSCTMLAPPMLARHDSRRLWGLIGDKLSPLSVRLLPVCCLCWCCQRATGAHACELGQACYAIGRYDDDDDKHERFGPSAALRKPPLANWLATAKLGQPALVLSQAFGGGGSHDWRRRRRRRRDDSAQSRRRRHPLQ
jgi:hypothetical protein